MKRLIVVGAAVLFTFALLATFIPPTYAAAPQIASAWALTGQSAGSVTLLLQGTTTGDKIIVFEWFGDAPGPCNSIFVPSDNHANVYSTLGCIQDGLQAGISAFYATNTQSGSMVVNCNYASPNTQTESCLVFDLSNAGAITLLGSNTGSSGSLQTTMGLQSSVTVASNALVLATFGIQIFCQNVAPNFNFGAGNTLPYSVYQYNTVSNGCYLNNFGMAGMYGTAGPGGASTTATASVYYRVIWSEMVVQVAALPVTSTTTSYTATVTAWLAPDSTHFSNSLTVMVFPLAGLVFGTMFAQFFKAKGDVGVYFALGGLTLGALVADIPTNTATSTNLVPFSYIIVAALLTFLYWWNQ